MAIALVLSVHAGKLSGGFVGVDLFFTLSGFLITNILFELENVPHKEALIYFFSRRSRRLVPVLVTVSIGAVVAGIITGRSPSSVGAEAMVAMTYTMNFAVSLFDFYAPLLIHTWSLAVEWQFYLLFPFAFFLLRRFRPSVFISALVLAVLFDIIWRLYLHFAGASLLRIYTMTDCRIDQLMIGALISFFYQQGATLCTTLGERASNFILAAGLICLFITAYLFEFSPQVYWTTSIQTIVSAMVIAPLIGNNGGAGVRRLLTIPALVHLGRISYSLYLWHWVVLSTVFALRGSHDFMSLAISLAASIALSELSWRTLEVRMLSGRRQAAAGT